jgi:hypothetical protein
LPNQRFGQEKMETSDMTLKVALLAVALTIVAPAFADTVPNATTTHPTLIAKQVTPPPKQVVKKPPPPCNKPNHQACKRN